MLYVVSEHDGTSEHHCAVANHTLASLDLHLGLGSTHLVRVAPQSAFLDGLQRLLAH